MKKKEQEIKEVIRYCPSIKEGLSLEQVEERKANGLINNVQIGSNKTVLSIILKNIFTFFNLMFLVIFILLLSANAPLFNYSFLILLTINTVIGIVQEVKAKKIIDKLSLESSPKSDVIRGSQKEVLNVNEIVLDDIIYLNAGSSIPTDSIIIEGDIEVNESQITGESIAIKKSVGDTIYSGSFLVSGNCYARVERIGEDNFIEKIAKDAKKMSKPKSEIMSSLSKLVKVVGFLFLPLGIILYSRGESINWAESSNKVAAFFMSFIHHSDTYSFSILNTSSALLGMIPSGLVLLTTVALAVGVKRLAKRNTLVQNIYCIEMLSHVDVLCLDKTGTITDGTMSVTRFIETKRGEYNVTEIVSNMNEALQEGNMTGKALGNYFGFSKSLKVKEILPFKSDNKYSAVTFEKAGTFVLGAPEFVLKSSFDKVETEVNDYANQGLRVLALAHSKEGIKDGKVVKIPKLIALILIEDQIRKEAFDTIKFFQDNNVNVKIISGDNPVTVSEVARRVGVKNADNYISLEGLSDEEVSDAANSYTVFGRVKPDQKRLLVKALQSQKHVVAMTGDGVNDILALKEADCSIAMASGCDAVKNVAQVVLLDSNFESMPQVVMEGRRAVNNLEQSASLYLVKTLFTIIIATLTAAGFLDKCFPGSGYPFIPAQLLPIEMFAIGLPSIILALQPNTRLVKGKFFINVIRRSIPGALTIGLQVIITYLLAQTFGFTTAELSTILIFTATATCLLVLYMACSPFNKIRIIMFGFVLIIISLIFTLFSKASIFINCGGLF